MKAMGRFAVIDTETNWADQVMSIGVVVADADDFSIQDARYLVFDPDYQIGGMYEGVLFPEMLPCTVTTRKEGMQALVDWVKGSGVSSIFAYNANFDKNHLPEFRDFQWFDIMRLAAYRQYNPTIPKDAECCGTGRLKRGYGVEPTLQRLSGNLGYQETHNALYDAVDELKIVRLLGHPLEAYIPL